MKRRFLASILTLLLLLTLTACGGGKAEEAAMKEAPAKTEEPAAAAPMEDYAVAYGSDMKFEVAESGSAGGGNAPAVQEQKLIITASMELETTEFEPAVQGLNELVDEYGGYFENSSVANRKSGSRRADYTVRVPAKGYEDFMNQVGTLCHETWRETSAQNITEAYYDTQGRLKTQQIKLERLQELLSKAELMEDIITIESAISETEWQIDELSGTLRHYDSKVDYATIYINLREVYKLSNVETVPDSFGQRMAAAFADGMRTFGENLENLAVSFAYGWIWWLLVIAAVVVTVRVLRRKNLVKLPRRKKKADDKQDET